VKYAGKTFIEESVVSGTLALTSDRGGCALGGPRKIIVSSNNAGWSALLKLAKGPGERGARFLAMHSDPADRGDAVEKILVQQWSLRLKPRRAV
jgi:hypothetical protein